MRLPPWWDEDCEEILRFVREYRCKRGIRPGTPVPMLWEQNECGYLLFGILAHTPEAEGEWHNLRDSGERQWVLARVRFEAQKAAA